MYRLLKEKLEYEEFQKLEKVQKLKGPLAHSVYREAFAYYMFNPLPDNTNPFKSFEFEEFLKLEEAQKSQESQELKWDISPITLRVFKQAFVDNMLQSQPDNTIQIKSSVIVNNQETMNQYIKECSLIASYFRGHKEIKHYMGSISFQSEGVSHKFPKAVTFNFEFAKAALELIKYELQKRRFYPEIKEEPSSSVCSIS